MNLKEKEKEKKKNLLTLLFFLLCFFSFFIERSLKKEPPPPLQEKKQEKEEERKQEIHPLSQSPLVFSIPNFLTLNECDFLVDYAKDSLERSTVVSQTGRDGPQVDSGRSSSGTWVTSRPDVVQRLEERLAEITHIPVSHGESLHILKYKEGEEYRPHYDWFNEEKMKEMATIGEQRIITVLIYLQTPQKGGETTFPEINLIIPPTKGTAILFYNLNEKGERDLLSLHSSLPVEEGEKWVAVKWLREGERGYGTEEWFW